MNNGIMFPTPVISLLSRCPGILHQKDTGYDYISAFLGEAKDNQGPQATEASKLENGL